MSKQLRIRLFCGAFLLSVMPFLFASGKKDTVDTPARSVNSWLETVDIADKKAGKYNILITAEDLAGNKGLAGPYNLYLDPASDLPVTGITNPLHSMRVPGNLNVVGTCIDDDAVDHVELLIDKSDTPIRAEGSAFWSYYLDTTKMAEGSHTISAYGVDVNGVRGKPVVAVWNLDRNRPETSVANKAMGALVSGNITFAGQVSDGNGIKRLSYSFDNGAKWIPIEIKRNRKNAFWTFSLPVNTLAMKDGPAVCWFKAEDGQGSEGISTFLCFVDNTKPDISFITPRADEAVNGLFSLAGTSRDTIGLASLTWRSGKETGEFKLVKGDPYWIREFDARNVKDKFLEVEITATDIAGNRTTVSRKIRVDQAADIPVLTMTRPEANSVVTDSFEASGFATDDDAIGAVWYSVDRGAPVKIDSSGAFALSVPGLSPGRHAAEFWPVDENFVEGKRVSIPFTVAGPAPSIKIDPPGDEFAEIHPESGKAITASISSPPGLKALSWTVKGRSPVAVQVKQGSTSENLKIPVGADFPYGLLSLEIRAVDIHDRETRRTTWFYVTNLGIPRDSPSAFADEKLKSSAEVTIPASGKTEAAIATATVAIDRVIDGDLPFANGMTITLAGPARPRDEQKDGAIRLSIDSPVAVTGVSWSLNGGAPGKASAQNAGGNSWQALIPLKASLPAEWTTLEATVTFKDLSTQTVSGTFCVVRPGTAGIFDAEQFAWDRSGSDSDDAIRLLDGSAVAGLYNGKSDRKAVSAAFAAPQPGLTLSLSGNRVALSGSKDGEYRGVSLIITDSSGGTFKTEPVTFIVDSAPPALSVDTSARPVWVQTVLPVKGTASDGRGIAKTDYSLDRGTTWTPFDGSQTSFARNIDVTPLPDGKIELFVRTTDLSGRETTDRRAFVKDSSPPVPVTVFPESGSVVNGTTSIGFDCRDATKIVSVEYRAPGDRSPKDKTAWVPLALSSLTHTQVGTADRPLSDKMEFRFTDSAGNSATLAAWQFRIDAAADLPVVEIHVPAENEIIRKDFSLSGVVYDDDKPAKVWYRIDEGEYASLPIENSYSIPIPLSGLTDNEHTLTVYAEDIYGNRGNPVSRKIRVSLEEPKASVRAPSFEKTLSGMLDITGVASDKNGIGKVEISLDNGNTFNLATGTDSWSYRFDTRVIQDGTHVVFVKVYDNYETTGLYSSLINIDNTAPSIKLELPLDGSRTAQTVFVSGQTLDNIGLERVSATINNIDPKQPAVPAALSGIAFSNDFIISRGIDVSALPEGFYNLEVRGYDRAGNVSRVSRNFEVFRGVGRNSVEFLYPMNGEKAQGSFNIYGRVVAEDTVKTVSLYADNVLAGTVDVLPTGFFKFAVTPGTIAPGAHQLVLRASLPGDKTVSSEPHTVIYSPEGPWVSVDNLAMGDFAIDRPWVEGSTGFILSPDETLALKDKKTPKDIRTAIAAKTPGKVEISFDNGKTFAPTELGKKWRYRVETGDIAEGFHFLVVRSTMKNGDVAVTRFILQVDKTLPSVRLISPGEGGHYNDKLMFSGLSSDDIRLESVTLSLRPGDKSAYAVPAFIQGLYFDTHFWGASLYDVGVGLTFFDDNVKLQGQFGQFTDAQRAMFGGGATRYGGNIYGIKLLANLAFIPMDYFLGPNFSWLSATGAVGANFSMFSETQSGNPQVLSAMLAQIEFPRVTIPKRTLFSTFSLYTEFQLWFIPTDVKTSEVSIKSLVPHITGGARLNVF